MPFHLRLPAHNVHLNEIFHVNHIARIGKFYSWIDFFSNGKLISKANRFPLRFEPNAHKPLKLLPICNWRFNCDIIGLFNHFSFFFFNFSHRKQNLWKNFNKHLIYIQQPANEYSHSHNDLHTKIQSCR